MQTGLICFEIVSKINGINVDVRAIKRQYGLTEADLSVNELLLIAKEAGFKAKLKDIPIAETERYPYPSIFILKESNEFAVLLKVGVPDKKALILIPSEQKPREITFDEFYAMSTGEIIFMSINWHKTE